jgi:membrane associated rhomboid family serine protease
VGLYDRDYVRDEYDQQGRGFSMPSAQSVTVALIAVNVAIFLVNFFSITDAYPKGLLNYWLRVTNVTATHPWLWFQFLTYGFAHDGPGHIFYNMLGLFFLGRAVEESLGPREYLRFYLIALLVGSLSWAAGLAIFYHQVFLNGFNGHPIGLLGASGAVSAVVMLFILRNPQATLVMFPIPIPVKAWVVGALMIVGNVYLSFENTSHVAWSVHLAGIAFAFFYFRGHWNFGYLDFGGWYQRLSQKAKSRSRPKLRVHRPAEDDEPTNLADEADRILDKISKHGESSLTKQEHRLMEIYSRKLRERRKE